MSMMRVVLYEGQTTISLEEYKRLSEIIMSKNKACYTVHDPAHSAAVCQGFIAIDQLRGVRRELVLKILHKVLPFVPTAILMLPKNRFCLTLVRSSSNRYVQVAMEQHKRKKNTQLDNNDIYVMDFLEQSTDKIAVL